ncbi:MAG: transcriptional regulator, LysR family [Clostridia bacterium]|jgi:DNA-binding transcriptional LysR family regulator|nr:transcriptional regulator, LysR family [Clostridia bacterium]
MDINFELYKVFYFVAYKKSFSAAANKLFISQSAVSQSIRQLEHKLGCPLFFRNTKKVKLTHEGQALFTYIEQAFNFIKTGEKRLEDMSSLVSGEIKIGASDTICKYYLMPYFKSFNEKYPGIKIKVTNRTSPKCIDLLKNGSVDFSVINIPQNTDIPQLSFAKSRAVRDVFVAGANYSHLKGKALSIKDLREIPLLVLEKNTITREYFDSLLEVYGLDLVPDIELGSIDVLLDMAKIGLGAAFVPDVCAEAAASRGEIFVLDIKEKIPERYMGTVTHKNIPLSLAAAKFLEMLGENPVTGGMM